MNNLFRHDFPFTDFHEMNLSWVVKRIIELTHTMDNFVNQNTIKYADPIQWDITKQYEANTIVINSAGTAYISSRPVPYGIALTNDHYWSVVFDLSEVIGNVNKNLTVHDDGYSTTSTYDLDKGEWVLWKGVLYRALHDIDIGDAYVVDANIEAYTVEDFYNDLAEDIESEAVAREEADTAISGDLAQEILDRQAGDTALSGDIDAEALARENADNALDDRIDDVNTVIGDITELNTSDKTSVVNAINSLKTEADTDIDNLINGVTNFNTLKATNTLKFAEPTSHSNYFNYLPYTDPNGNTVNLLTANTDIDKLGVNNMYVNVLNYGADSTGVNDSTTAIQDAINYASTLTNGGIVYIPTGTYLITNTLRLKGKVSLLGDGQLATYLNCSFANNNIHVAIDAHGEPIGGCFIKGMKIWRDVKDVSSVSYPLWLRQAGILFGCTVEEYNQAIFRIEDVCIRNFVCGISGGYYHSTQNAIGLFDSILDNVWCVDCSATGIALGGSGNQIRHPRLVSCGTGIMFIRISDESFDGDLIVGGIFIANAGYDITFRDAGLYRPIRFIDTWFEQSGAGIINVPFTNTKVTTFGMEGCLFNSNTTQYDTFTCCNITDGIIELRNCCMYLTVAGGNNNIVFPATTTRCRGVATNCTKVDRDGAFMIYEKLT